jgi:RepB DNA-primase from phage plasmid
MASRWLQTIVSGTKTDFAVKSLRSVSRKCTKEWIATVRGLCIDFDIGGQGNLTSIRASDAIPAPSAFILTLPGKYQVLLRTDCKMPKLQESRPRLPAFTIGSDLFWTNVKRIHRSPGIRDCRYDPAYRVTVKCPSDSTWIPSNFRLDTLVRMPRSCAVQFHRESILENPRIPPAIGCVLCNNSPVERPPPKGANFRGGSISMGNVVTMRHVRRSVRNSRRTLPSLLTQDCARNPELITCAQV